MSMIPSLAVTQASDTHQTSILPAWEVAGQTLYSRCILGSGGMIHLASLTECIIASGCEIMTVSIRRAGSESLSHGLLKVIQEHNLQILPNTAGSLSAHDAVFTARMAREALGTNWIKLEVVADLDSHLPDTKELLRAAEELVEEGFHVFAYTNDDPIIARYLTRIGCAAIMPGGAPIGTGLGVLNPYNIATIVQESPVPVIVDAGLGTASDATLAMELGATAILLATAVHRADNPPMMAKAVALAVEAGALAHLAGRIPRRESAFPSSPIPDFTV